MSASLVWLRSAVTNWRTSLPALVTLAGVVVALSHVVDLPVGLVHACEVAVSLATALGLLSAADAKRLADVEAVVLPKAARVPAKANPEDAGSYPNPYGEKDGAS